MKNSYKKSKKNLLALCLSVLMLTSGAAAFAACSDDVTDSSSSSEDTTTEDVSTTVNDDGLIQNADFKIGTDSEDKDLTPIFTSVSNWSRSVNSVSSGTALSSKAASGVVNTSADAWNNLTTSKKNVAEMSDEDVKAAWNELSVKDKLEYYELWKEKNSDGTIAEDLEFYEAFNIDSGDIPTCKNPGTHYADATDKDTNVLMIHNEYPESDSTSTYKALGTAQKYTSSSTVTVPAGTAAEFSVWVKTQDLKMSSSDGTAVAAVGKGAYINVTHSVGSKSLPVLSVCNINTEYIEEGSVADEDYSNGWVKYSFYLKGSSYADTTFSVVLGLGQGGGTDRHGYVNGYAFFDDIQCKLITPDAYDDYAAANLFSNTTVDFDDLKEDKEFNIAKNGSLTKFALDFYGDFADFDLLASLYNATDDADIQAKIAQHIKATESKYKGEEKVTSQAGNKPLPALNGGLDGSNDVTKVFDGFADIAADAASNSYLEAVYNGYFKDTDFAKDEKILLLLSANGVAYTADFAANADTTLGRNIVYSDFLDDNDTPAVDTDDTYADYLAISFFVKTSDMNGFTGAGITLKDGVNKTSFVSLDTSEIVTVDLDGNEDIYDGWQQCFFFVENKFENKADVNFSLSFSFGPTTITGTTKDSYYAGFAAFADFNIYPMNKTEYASAASGTYAKVVSVTGNVAEEGTGSNGFDEAANVPSNALEVGLADAKNYKGVYNNNYYVNQTSGTTKEINTNKNAGLISKDFFVGTKENESYYDATSSVAWMKGLTEASGATGAEGVWNSIFGDSKGIVNATRPLMIWNDGSANTYGYIGNSTTIAANTYTKISVAVKVGADTNKVANLSDLAAYIYLVDMDDDSYNQTLSIGRDLIYWYDDQGNILTGDPDDKSTEIAFKLQTNGLYKVNQYWSGYKTIGENSQYEYFANFSNYEKDPVTGNLLVADGGATHAYSDKYNHAGENGIAFYCKKETNNYFLDAELTKPVRSLGAITQTGDADLDQNRPLSARYTAEENKQLMAKVGYTDGEWAHVSFYIHTGATAKNYRLEVWSGARDAGATANPANSYVIFDMNYAGDAESNFTTLVDEHKDDADAVSFESVFSYYDSAKFLRYDANLDENNVGNVYKDSYKPSDYTEGVAYLDYTEGNERRIFADYSYSDVTVAAAVEDDTTDTEEEETEKETASETNFWLLASSVAIAVVLVLAVLSILIRKVMEKVNKGRKKKVRAPKAKKEKKVKAAKVENEKVDEDSPYND